jgi:rhodanese-related sulfurtransferase
MGWDAVVLEGGLHGARLETGMPAPNYADFPLAGPEPAEIEAKALDPKSAIVVDLALSKRHRAGHVPGARFAIRARLEEALAKLPEARDIVLTSEDGALARFAAAEAGRKVRVLKGGTEAWRRAGLPLEEGFGALLSEADDVALSARERPAEERERRMREYLDWEVDLVNQIARDSDCRFRLNPA